MKLLLTSDGITNRSIEKALFDLVGKPADQTRLAFIPTAVNATRGDKSWFVDALYEIKNLGLKHLDIVDFSAIPKNAWLPMLEEADVLFFCGGNSSHLMRCIKETGLIDILPKLIENKVYAALSAGSTITAPDLSLANEDNKKRYKEVFGYESNEALHLVDFYTQSHLNSPKYPERTEENMKIRAKQLGKKVYALDRDSAVKVVDGNVEIISEGKYLELGPELEMSLQGGDFSKVKQ